MEKIILNDGQRDVSFELLDTFGVDDKDYAALLNEEDGEIYLMEISFEGQEAIFKTIEDKKTFDEVLAFYNELLDEDVDQEQ
ncbi:DUF1292 domain-containing protein [Peptoniphilaceae bacterium SGI.131]